MRSLWRCSMVALLSTPISLESSVTVLRLGSQRTPSAPSIHRVSSGVLRSRLCRCPPRLPLRHKDGSLPLSPLTVCHQWSAGVASARVHAASLSGAQPAPEAGGQAALEGGLTLLRRYDTDAGLLQLRREVLERCRKSLCVMCYKESIDTSWCHVNHLSSSVNPQNNEVPEPLVFP